MGSYKNVRPEIIAEYIAGNYTGKVVEVGIGRNWKVAEILAERGFEVVAVDVLDMRSKGGVRYFRDDVTNPRLEIYRNASLIYSIRPPVERYSCIVGVAKLVGADCLIRPFGNEFPNGRLVNYCGERFYVWEF